MRIGRIESIEVLAALCLALVFPPAWSAVETLEMQVGESRVLAQPGVTRVAIGNSQVLSAVATDDREVVVSARAEGVSSMHVWAEAGLASYDVRVVAAGTPRLLAEVDSLLARIPGTRSTLVGSQVVIEGEGLSDDDRARVAALAQRYPEVVDFTGQVGWDSMVLLDVQVVEIPSSRLRELGVRWDGVTQGGLNAALAWDAGSRGRMSRPGEQPVDTPLPVSSAAGYFGVNALLSARIAALAQRGEAVMLAQPQLLARSGASATFLAGGRSALRLDRFAWQSHDVVQALWGVVADHAAYRSQRRHPFADRGRGQLRRHGLDRGRRAGAAYPSGVDGIQRAVR